MLPGFRFLFAAIVLSMSVLVFGLGAAALLRAAHEEFASSAPLWRALARSRNLPSRTSHRGSPRGTRHARAGDAAASNRSRRSCRPRTALRRPRRQPSHRRSPRRRMQPEKIAALESQDKTPPEAAKPEIPSRNLRCKARRTPPMRPPLPKKPGSRQPSRPLRRRTKSLRPHPNRRSRRLRRSPRSLATKIATLGGPSVAIEAQPTADATGRRKARPERRQGALAGAARRRAAQDRVARATGGSTTGRRSVRAADDHDPQPLKLSVCAYSDRKTGIHFCGIRARHAGPVAIGGPSGRPHSAHEPS